MNENKYKEIRNTYGDETIHQIRRMENRSKAVGRYRSHLRFNLQCKHTEIIPKSIQISYKSKDEASRAVIRKAERALLNVRVSNIVTEIKRIERQLKTIDTNLRNTIPQTIYETIQRNNKQREIQTFNKTRDNQKKKYQQLVTKQTRTNNANRNDEERERAEGEVMETQTEQELEIEENTTPQDPGTREERGEEGNNMKERWVKNISSKTITDEQLKLLQKGAGFAITPQTIPTDEFIIATELAGKQIHPGAAAAMKAEIAELLKNAKRPKSNITKGERTAIKQLQKDDTLIILPADKGKCLVIMDKAEYITKMEDKLKDTTTYRKIDTDPTTRVKKLLADKLKEIFDNKEINYATYMHMYPNTTQIPRMYGQPKVHKQGNPLREIVDGNGSIFKNIDKHISKIIQPLTGKTEHYVKNSKHFVDSVKDIIVEEDETLVSYDVTALYPSVPQDEAIDLIYHRLMDDTTLQVRTKMTPQHIIELFKLFVHNMYFVFNSNLYEQLNGLAIGASTSGFAAEIFMEKIEDRAINTFIQPPTLWKRYVDDTFSKLKKIYINNFLEHLNSLHPRIKFTTETMEDNKLAFLDTEVNVTEEGRLKFKIYRKATHTDQYLNFTSNHHIKQKLGIINTFTYRNEMIITDENDRKEEDERIKKNLRKCDYPEWALQKKKKKKKKNTEDNNNPRVTIPYINNLSDKVARTFRKYNVETTHKPSQTIKNTLCKLKDKVHKWERPGTNYKIKCKIHKEHSYIGETHRAMKYRAYEHGIIKHNLLKSNLSLKPDETNDTTEPTTTIQDPAPQTTRRSSRLQKKNRIDYKKMDSGTDILIEDKETTSEVAEHMASGPHEKEDMECEILGYEDNWWKRGIREAIDIRRHKPTLNKDKGRYNLGPIWTEIIEEGIKSEPCNLIGGENRRRNRNISTNFTTEEDQPTGG